MVKGLNIPDEFQYTFKRLINLVPYKQRNDRHAQKIVLLYLKLGGEKLAKQYIEILKSDLSENKDRTETSEKSNPAGRLISDPNSPKDKDSEDDDKSPSGKQIASKK